MESRFWVPVSKKKYFFDVLSLLSNQTEFAGFRTTQLDYQAFNKKPPTLFETNTFSEPFQEIVDTYGVPNYKEVNPGLFTMVTFPFLFGVMFGDVGHGLLLFLFGLFLIFAPNLPEQIKRLKYMITMMGFFALYCGLIYSDFFAVPLPLTTSCYSEQEGSFVRKEGCYYPVGFDHSWHHSTNFISYMNSFKMKLSIVIGVVHMVIGICMKGINAIYFRNFSDFFLEFIP